MAIKIWQILTSILVLIILGGVGYKWVYDKEHSTLYKDDEIIARHRWVIQAERTYLVKNSWYRTNVMCPKIIEMGGYETTTRCYYPPDYYEDLKRSLVKIKVTTEDLIVERNTPFYKYGTKGAYAGILKEIFEFIETERLEEFPKNYTVSFNPKDTRNYKLVWRVWNLDINIPNGNYTQCIYNFDEMKIDLKDECSKLERAEVKDDRIWFYFNAQKGEQSLSMDLVDPSGEWCYQETATTSTPCGGLDTGGYDDSLWAGGNGPCDFVYDGDWDTFCWADLATDWLEINYTKPATATISSLWQTKDYSGIRNISLTADCWSLSPLQLKITSVASGHGFFYCRNETDWHLLFEGGANSFGVYEEAMWWDIEAVDDILPIFNALEIAGNPGEEAFGTDVPTYYFYRNGTNQTEDYMYIKVNVTDDVGISNVTLEWKNEAGWTNYTMEHESGTDYYYINMSNQSTWGGYTFNIYANDTSGNEMSRYNWTFYDYESSWGTQEEWRKYVGLNVTPREFVYEQFYLWYHPYTSDQRDDRVLPHEQPTDATINDTGVWRSNQPTTKQYIYCMSFIEALLDETYTINETILNNTYIHIWWGSKYNKTTIFYVKSVWEEISGETNETFSVNQSSSVANMTYSDDADLGYTQYWLESKHWIFNKDYTYIDNDINLFGIGASQALYKSSFISTLNYSSFIILNLPDNTTLQGLDTDSDGLNDYDELYSYYTDPKDSDTDNGGENDKSEVDNNRNPLDPRDDDIFAPIVTILHPINSTVYPASVDLNWTYKDNSSLDWCAYNLDSGTNDSLFLYINSSPHNDLCGYDSDYVPMMSQIKFDISNVPTDKKIINVSMCVYSTTLDGNPGPSFNLSRVDDQTWTGDISSTVWNAQSIDTITKRDISSMALNTWGCIDVLEQFNTEYGVNDNLTIRMWSAAFEYDPTITNTDDGIGLYIGDWSDPPQPYNYVIYEDEENSQGSGKTPYLEILYGFVNTTLTSLSGGLHNITIFCNDTVGNMGQSNYTYFIVDEISDCTTLNNPGNYKLTQNIIDSAISKCINIISNDVTLDCQGYTIDGDGQTQDIGIYSNANNVIIKNCIVGDWKYDFYFENTNNNSLLDSKHAGTAQQYFIYSDTSTNLIFNNVSGSSSESTCFLKDSENVTIRNSSFSKSSTITAHRCLYIHGTQQKYWEHDIDETNNCTIKTGIGTYPLKYIDGNNILCPDNQTLRYNTTYAGLWLVGCDNITVKDSTFYDGLWLAWTDNSKFNNLTLQYAYYNLNLQQSNFNRFENISILKTGYYGLTSSSYNIFKNILIDGQMTYGAYINAGGNNLTNFTINGSYTGIYFTDANNNILTNSTIKESTSKGIEIKNSQNNLIYNNLLNNTINVVLTPTIYTNSWNTTKQTGTRIYSGGTNIGGNYWTNSSGDDYSDTCIDLDNDGFCDVAYDVENDASGCTSDNCDYFTLSDEYDETAPIVDIIYPVSDTAYGYSSIDLNWSYSDDSYIDWCAYSLDNEANNTAIADEAETSFYGYDLNFENYSAYSTGNIPTTAKLVEIYNGSDWFKQDQFDSNGNYNITFSANISDYLGDAISYHFPVYTHSGDLNIESISYNLSLYNHRTVGWDKVVIVSDYDTSSNCNVLYANFTLIPDYINNDKTNISVEWNSYDDAAGSKETSSSSVTCEGIEHAPGGDATDIYFEPRMFITSLNFTNITLTGLSDGLHNITIYCNDTVGNMGQSDYIYFTTGIMSINVTLGEGITKIQWRVPFYTGTTAYNINATNQTDNVGLFRATNNGSMTGNLSMRFNDTYGGWCYQESANISTACGGLDTGVYHCDESYWDTQGGHGCDDVIDGDWEEAGARDQEFDNASVYINYTKPLGALGSSLWMVGDDRMIDNPIDRNLSIPSDCWANSPLQLRVSSGLDGDYLAYWFCYNATGWELMNISGPASFEVREEAMWWDMGKINTECSQHNDYSDSIVLDTSWQAINDSLVVDDMVRIWCRRNYTAIPAKKRIKWEFNFTSI